MGIHIIKIPDCPKCGKEMQKMMKYKEGTQTKNRPFGIPIRWWECLYCGERVKDDADK